MNSIVAFFISVMIIRNAEYSKSNTQLKETGTILCTKKDETLVKYSLMPENEKSFASKYGTYLYDEKELKQLIKAGSIKLELDNKK